MTWWSALALADTLTVGSGATPTLQDALAAAQDGDTVLVPAGTWQFPATITADVTVRADLGAQLQVAASAGVLVTGDVVLEGGEVVPAAGVRAFGVAGALTLRGVVVTGGAGVDGGAIACSDARVTLEEAIFTRPAASHDGGAVWASGCEVTSNRSVFDGASAVGNGGAVALTAGASLSSTDDRFVDGAAGLGGAVWVDGGDDLLVTRGVFEGNTSGDYGGAIAAYTTAVRLDEARFCWNTAERDGSAVYAEDTSVSAIGSQFFANDTGASGTVRVREGSLVLERATFAENLAETTGSGVLVNAGAPSDTLTASASLFVDQGSTGAVVLDLDDTNDIAPTGTRLGAFGVDGQLVDDTVVSIDEVALDRDPLGRRPNRALDGCAPIATVTRQAEGLGAFQDVVTGEHTAEPSAHTGGPTDGTAATADTAEPPVVDTDRGDESGDPGCACSSPGPGGAAPWALVLVAARLVSRARGAPPGRSARGPRGSAGGLRRGAPPA